LNNQDDDDRAEAKPPAIVFLTKKQVLARIPITAPTLWSWCRAGKFPMPVEICPNKVGWVEAAVTDWQRTRPIRRYKP
jgi:predicted DNA-binding transcriptional regulator AlpA